MKNKIIAVLLLSSLFFTSCIKQTVTQPTSTTFTIHPSDWITTDGSLSYSVNLNVPGLNNYILQNGAVDVYLSFSDGEYETIPELFDGIAYGSVQYDHIVRIDMYGVNGGVIPAPNETIFAKVVLVNANPN